MSAHVSTLIPFSAAIRDRTRLAHEEAESSPFVRELMEGKRSRADYIALAGQQYFVYRALEEIGARLRDDPQIGALLSAELDRLDAIEADLDFLDPGWREHLVPLPATQAYVDRLHEIANWPGGYLAHHYTRYLGDLSGGQIIRTMLQRHYGLGEEGIAFYRFPEITKPKVFKDEYRAALDAVPFDEAERERVLEEANVAFRCNEAMFIALDQASAAA